MFNKTISIAPMMGWTDRHARYFLRQISSRVVLYTEMVTTGAILHGCRESLLKYDPAEQPLVLQLGGSDPLELVKCSAIAEQEGYKQINLNVGCPSDRVKQGAFGACLMAQPELVAECVAAMNAQVSIPVTVKCRTGIDDMEGYDVLEQFVTTVAEAGCPHFIVHARKAWLQGLSPRQNREIPPLKYELVYRLKQSFPSLEITINGGIKTFQEIEQHLEQVDGVMLGREAYHNPYLLAEVDQLFLNSQEKVKSRQDVIEAMVPYIDQQQTEGVALHSITRHMHGLFLGCPGAKAWRRYLSEHDNAASANSRLLREASSLVNC